VKRKDKLATNPWVVQAIVNVSVAIGVICTLVKHLQEP